jgi:hypothetical protein
MDRETYTGHVIELRDDGSVPIEPLTELGIGHKRWRQDLQGEGAVETRVSRLVHLAHAARAEQRHDLIRAKPSAGGQSH